MDARLCGMKDTRVGRRNGAAVSHRARLTLGAGLSSEPLIREARARCASITITVDAMLSGAEDARVCRRNRVTVSNGTFDGSVMNAGLASVLSLEPLMCELVTLWVKRSASVVKIWGEPHTSLVTALKGILDLVHKSRHVDDVRFRLLI